MLIELNITDPDWQKGNEDWVRDEVANAVRHFEYRVTRVAVHIRDVNGPKGGVDKVCAVEAHISGRGPLTVKSGGTDAGQAVHQAAEKLSNSLARRLTPHDAHKREPETAGE